VTEGRLVVKNCCPPSPPLGTLARAMSNFFEVPPGSILPAVLVLTISATIFMLRMVRSRQRFWLPLAFAITNLLFFVGALFLIMVADGLADLWCPPNYVGYLATGPSILALVLALGLLWDCSSGFRYVLPIRPTTLNRIGPNGAPAYRMPGLFCGTERRRL